MEQFGAVDPAEVWRSASSQLDAYRLRLDPTSTDTLLRAARVAAEAGRDPETLSPEDLPVGALADQLDELRRRVLHGPGFALVDGFPIDDVDESTIAAFFWGIGLQLGRPVSQSVMGERLGHVRDVTRTDPNARAYRNRSELTPHSDPADLLAFLCLRPAARGGVSRFVSSLAIHEELRRSRPDLLARLYRGYRYHRLGEQQPGRPDITPHRVPVFSVHEGHVSCRYVRQYIEVAAEEDPAITLDELDREAFALLEQLSADPALHFEFTLSSGEAVFANNFTVLHARSSFVDDAGPGRHLLRLWLAADPPRPLTPTIQHFEDEPGIQPVAGRTPSYDTSVEVQ